MQWTTDHLRSLGAVDVPRSEYLSRLADAIEQSARPREAVRDPTWTRQAATADNEAMTDEVQRDRPWMMRTYSGHSTARASNELYRTNLARGQTGLSIAFDLPTQTGYDPDDPLAHGEVGKVGVPVAHIGHMGTLLDQIPVDEMNTSMTINATAAWLLGLYVANAERQGVDSKPAAGHDAERHREGVPQPGDLHLSRRCRRAA